MKTQDTGLRATPGRAPRVSPAAEDLPEEAVVIDGHREAEERERSGDNEEDKGERSGPGSEAQGWASRQPPRPSMCCVRPTAGVYRCRVHGHTRVRTQAGTHVRCIHSATWVLAERRLHRLQSRDVGVKNKTKTTAI